MQAQAARARGAPEGFERDVGRGRRGVERVMMLLRRGGYAQREATEAEEFQGVDLVVWDRDGSAFTVEVKTDYQAHRTDNAFIETISNDASGRLGWALTCRADWLAYLIDASDTLYWIQPELLRTRIPEWEQRASRGSASIRHASCPQAERAHATRGLLVPLAALEDVATEVVCL